MNAKKPLVIVTRKLPDVIETRLMELFNTRLNLKDAPLSKEELVAAVSEADVLVPTVTDRIDAEILSQAGSNLKLIASFGTGIDHIDFAATKANGIMVTNTPSVLTEDTADMTMALILAAPRRLSEGERLMRAKKWAGWAESVRQSPIGRVASAFLSTTTIDVPFMRRRRPSLKQPIGKASTKCFPIWTLFLLIAHIH